MQNWKKKGDCKALIFQAVVKAMELLAMEGKIKEKIYGKQKIYFADQVCLFLRNVHS